MSTLNDDLKVVGNLTVTGALTLIGALSARPRSELVQENLAEYPIPLTHFRVWDALGTPLGGTPAADDLGIAGNVYGTDSPYITTGDVKAAGAITRRARVQFQLPPEYVAGETVSIRVSAGMLTTVADVSATVDVEAFVNGRDRTIDGADLVTTAAQSINSLTMADKTFVVTPTTLVPGDELDIRLTIATNDAATVGVVAGTVGAFEMLLDIKG